MNNMSQSYKIDYTVTASARNIKEKYPVRELKPAKVVRGELVGPSFLVGNKGTKTTDVSADIYRAAKEQGIRVTLRQFKNGVRVYRVPE